MINEINLFDKALNSFLNKSIKLKKKKRLKKVYFLRNEQVENFVRKINYYTELSSLKFNFFFSGYDNNLNIPKKKYDLVIIWLDYSNYKINNEFFHWIKAKVDALTSFCDYILVKPIIIPNTSLKKITNLNNLYRKKIKNEKVIFLDIADEIFKKKKDFWDLERSEFFGTKTSLYGQDLYAKLLGLQVLPSLFNQKIKSIIFDLDDTLYNGTVGEDGVKKIYLDKNQKNAEKLYSLLSKNGTLLSISSKNNYEDVVDVFKKKILKKKLFYPIKANWMSKSKNIKDIQKILKISFQNILFIDNNISEVIEVKKNIPEINVFWSKNSESLINCLKYYPNLRDYFNSEFKSINIKRLNDLKAFSKREKFLLSAKNDNYLEELKTKIDFRLNNKKEFNRIFSLVNKVNQFIFNYKRFNKTQVKEYYKNSNKFVFTISLKDKFSDSGNIGVIFFSKINNIMYLDELCISCRALGRNLENYFIFYPLQILSKKIKFDKVFINFKRGAKNKPAETYFGILHKKFFNKKLIKTRIEIPISQINQDLIKNSNISVSFKN
jgi:FkbH-like protein